MITKFRSIGSWPFWTGFLLVALIVILLLGTTPTSSQAPLAVEALQISKSVNMPSVLPGQVPAPLYTVSFTNTSMAPVTLDTVTDVLPIGFEFLGMHATSDVSAGPDDDVEPEIVWQGPIEVPGNSTLSMVYAVGVPGTIEPSVTPYENSVTAAIDGAIVGPASAKLVVGEADLTLDKKVSSARVLNGGTVTYTVALTNAGYMTSTVEIITDTHDPEVTFLAMADDSDVMTPPQANAGTLTWSGPIDVPPLSSVLLRYQATATDEPGWFYPCNQVDLLADGGTLGPQEVCINVAPEKSYVYLPLMFRNYRYPSFAVSKTAVPTVVQAGSGDPVVYTLDIVNEGDDPAILESVVDILPQGFVFQGMVTGSDLTTNPTGTSGTITWNGPWVVPARGDLSVIYRVTPTEAPGTYLNKVSVTSSNAFVPAEPASASVTIQPPTLLEEHFESGIGRWTKFLNYWRLTEEQWYHGQNDGVGGSGAATQNCTLGKVDPLRGAEDALLMYMGEGAESWSNYRVETKILLRGGISETSDGDAIWVLEGGYPIGLWVRGQLLNLEPNEGGGNVTGYYVVVGGRPGRDMFVRLAQLQTLTDCWDLACDNPQNLYDFNNPHTLTESRMNFSFERNQWYTLVVEVEGNWIRAWVNGVPAIEYQDTKEPFLTGTIGLKTYKSWTASFDDIVVTPLSD